MSARLADSPLVWARPAATAWPAVFCAVVGRGASVLTACFGRWEPRDGDEIRWDVPAGLRCGGCVRALAAGAVRAERAAMDVVGELDAVPRVVEEGATEPGAFEHLEEGLST